MPITDDSHGVPAAALELLGAEPRAAKRSHLFGTERQPSRKQREQAIRRRFATEYIQDVTKRQATLNRHLKALDRDIRMLESSTGASLVCVALPGGAYGGKPRLIGHIGTALMRGVYSAPAAAQLRNVILEEAAAVKTTSPAASAVPQNSVPVASTASTRTTVQSKQSKALEPKPLKLRKMSRSAMIKQLQTLLPQPGQLPGTNTTDVQLAQDVTRPEDWWPSDLASAEDAGADAAGQGNSSASASTAASASTRAVRGVQLSDKYPLKQMSIEDLSCVYDAFGKYLVTRVAYRGATAAAKAVCAATAARAANAGFPQPRARDDRTEASAVGGFGMPMSLPGDVFDRRPAVLKEDIEYQMMTRWRASHPTEYEAIIADAKCRPEAEMCEVTAADATDSANADDAENVLPGGETAAPIPPSSQNDPGMQLDDTLGLELGFQFEVDSPTWRPEDNIDLGLGEGGAGSSDEEEYNFEEEEHADDEGEEEQEPE